MWGHTNNKPNVNNYFKSLIALKQEINCFCFPSSAQKCSAEAARIVRDAAIAAGAPENCIQWIEQPSIDATSALMNHPGLPLF